MSKRYTGGVVSSAVPTVNAASASGIFTLGQQATAQSNNNWPPFKVEKSLRFRAAASGYLSRTPAVASNRTTWTYSAWIKRGDLTIANRILIQPNVSFEGIYFDNATNALRVQSITGTTYDLRTTQLFRDPAAWYHIRRIL